MWHTRMPTKDHILDQKCPQCVLQKRKFKKVLKKKGKYYMKD